MVSGLDGAQKDPLLLKTYSNIQYIDRAAMREIKYQGYITPA
jgi:hypothetical protein